MRDSDELDAETEDDFLDQLLRRELTASLMSSSEAVNRTQPLSEQKFTQAVIDRTGRGRKQRFSLLALAIIAGAMVSLSSVPDIYPLLVNMLPSIDFSAYVTSSSVFSTLVSQIQFIALALFAFLLPSLLQLLED